MEARGMSTPQSRAHFECSRVNSTTFVIRENDKYREYPFIYIKIYNDPPLVAISDTGCGGPEKELDNTQAWQRRDLKGFIETIPVPSNDNRPLNPLQGSGKPAKKYLIICTHCHYDHILGIEAFQDSKIVASGYDKAFVQNDLAEHSLCKYIPIAVPTYQISLWAGDREWLKFDGKKLDLQILHTPGHTPDELAWYDKEARHLYVGDSMYERVAKDRSYEQAIVFPNEGSIIDYLSTLEMLLAFVQDLNAEPGRAPLKLGCGHVTAAADAQELISEVQRLFQRILVGEVPVVKEEEKRGERFMTWKEDGEPRFSVEAPLKLIMEARRHRNVPPDY